MDEKIENNFKYHEANKIQNEKYEKMRNKAKELAYLIEEIVPNSREKSLAMTKLEECCFWADAGISRN